MQLKKWSYLRTVRFKINIYVNKKIAKSKFKGTSKKEFKVHSKNREKRGPLAYLIKINFIKSVHFKVNQTFSFSLECVPSIPWSGDALPLKVNSRVNPANVFMTSVVVVVRSKLRSKTFGNCQRNVSEMVQLVSFSQRSRFNYN